MKTNNKLIAMTSALLIGGCALPGYDSGAIDSGDWYDFSSDDGQTYEERLSEETLVDYDPKVVKITPQLIRYQQRTRDNSLPPDVLKLTQPSKTSGYTVGKGDVLRVVVFGHPELTNPGGGDGGESARGQLVDADGQIYFPYVGELHVEGMTLPEVRQALRKSLSSYIRQPQVDVRVSQYRSQRVYISGDIAKPCAIPITDIQLNIVEALDACQTLATKSGGGVAVQNIRLIRGQESILIRLNNLYASGKDVELQPGDRLLIDDTANRVFMVGEFDQQTALPYSTGGLSLNDAIANVGGINLGTADTSNIYVIRGFVDGRDFEDGGVRTSVRPNVYVLDASNPASLLLANQFELQPRDVVFAAPASFVNFNRALSLILPSLDLLTRSYYLFDNFGSN